MTLLRDSFGSQLQVAVEAREVCRDCDEDIRHGRDRMREHDAHHGWGRVQNDGKAYSFVPAL